VEPAGTEDGHQSQDHGRQQAEGNVRCGHGRARVPPLSGGKAIPGQRATRGDGTSDGLAAAVHPGHPWRHETCGAHAGGGQDRAQAAQRLAGRRAHGFTITDGYRKALKSTITG